MRIKTTHHQTETTQYEVVKKRIRLDYIVTHSSDVTKDYRGATEEQAEEEATFKITRHHEHQNLGYLLFEVETLDTMRDLQDALQELLQHIMVNQ